MAIATMTLATGAHPMFPASYDHMTHERSYELAIWSAYLFVAALYLPIAGVGYAMFGDSVASPVYRSLPGDLSNLPDHTVSIIALVTIVIIFSFPIVIMVPELALEGYLKILERPAHRIVVRLRMNSSHQLYLLLTIPIPFS